MQSPSALAYQRRCGQGAAVSVQRQARAQRGRAGSGGRYYRLDKRLQIISGRSPMLKQVAEGVLVHHRGATRTRLEFGQAGTENWLPSPTGFTGWLHGMPAVKNGLRRDEQRATPGASAQALVSVDATRPHHVIIDPMQATAWSNVGWQMLRDAGLDMIARLILQPPPIALPQLFRRAASLMQRLSTAATDSTRYSLISIPSAKDRTARPNYRYARPVVAVGPPRSTLL